MAQVYRLCENNGRWTTNLNYQVISRIDSLQVHGAGCVEMQSTGFSPGTIYTSADSQMSLEHMEVLGALSRTNDAQTAALNAAIGHNDTQTANQIMRNIEDTARVQ